MSDVFANIGKLQRKGPFLQVVALVVLFLYGTFTLTGFAELNNVKSMLVLAALLGLASVGQTLVLILQGIDFSVPGFIFGGAVLISELCGTKGWPFALALPIVIIVAGLLGGFVGWVCVQYRVQPLIVTLGMGAIVLGATLVVLDGKLAGQAPAFLGDLSRPKSLTFGFIELPPVVLIWALVAVIVGFCLHRTAIGRRHYATGANPRAAGIAGMPVKKIWTGAFAISAIGSALVGVLLAGYQGTDAAMGDPYLFTSLTAVIVGGLTFGGARGDYTHTVLGALILTLLTSILIGNNVQTAEQQMIFGALILVVVFGYGRDRRVQDRV